MDLLKTRPEYIFPNSSFLNPKPYTLYPNPLPLPPALPEGGVAPVHEVAPRRDQLRVKEQEEELPSRVTHVPRDTRAA